MECAIISLSPNGQARWPKRISDPGLAMVYSGYAPRVWVVSYKGTVEQLADLLWPDDTPPEEYEIPAGLVIRLKARTISGYASRSLWDVLGDMLT